MIYGRTPEYYEVNDMNNAQQAATNNTGWTNEHFEVDNEYSRGVAQIRANLEAQLEYEVPSIEDVFGAVIEPVSQLSAEDHAQLAYDQVIAEGGSHRLARTVYRNVHLSYRD